MGTPYEKDVVAWAMEQAALLRAGQLSALDIEHIAEEIEDVGKSEERELASRMAVLLAHLLKWQARPERQGPSWRLTIAEQRRSILRRLDRTPSLRTKLADPEWQEDAWGDARGQAAQETGLSDFPAACPWSMEQVLSAEFLPQG